MTIEFKCSGCTATLRVGDEHAGKSARCPTCQMVMGVPSCDSKDLSTTGSDQQAFPSSFPPPFEIAQRSQNPYKSPISFGTSTRKQIGGELVPRAVQTGRIINHSYNLWQENLGPLVLATIIVGGIALAVSLAIALIELVAVEITNDEKIGMLVSYGLEYTVEILANGFMTIGMTRFCLAIARGEKPALNILFSGGDQILPFFCASFLYAIAMMIGSLLFLIPALLLALFFWPYAALIADRQAGVMDSFSKGFEMAKLNVGTTLVLALASFAIMLLGFLAICIGALFAAPLVSMIWVTAYAMMNGELLDIH